MVSIRSSVTRDHVVCLEDGKKMTMLKRHLMTDHGLTPDEYRARGGLGSDYPMVAPDYADKRRDLAKKIGLGRQPGQRRGGARMHWADRARQRRKSKLLTGSGLSAHGYQWASIERPFPTQSGYTEIPQRYGFAGLRDLTLPQA